MLAYIAPIGGGARAELQLLEIGKKNAAAGSRVPPFSYVARRLGDLRRRYDATKAFHITWLGNFR